jgi:hypothetical protein
VGKEYCTYSDRLECRKQADKKNLTDNAWRPGDSLADTEQKPYHTGLRWDTVER